MGKTVGASVYSDFSALTESSRQNKSHAFAGVIYFENTDLRNYPDSMRNKLAATSMIGSRMEVIKLFDTSGDASMTSASSLSSVSDAGIYGLKKLVKKADPAVTIAKIPKELNNLASSSPSRSSPGLSWWEWLMLYFGKFFS